MHLIAPRYKVSKWALSRHKRKCISAAVVKSAADREGASATNLLAVVQGLIMELEELKSSARRKRNGGPEVRKNIEVLLKSVSLLADLAGIRAAPQVHVNLQVPTSSKAFAEAAELVLLLASPEQFAELQNRFLERAGARRPLLEGDVVIPPTEAVLGATCEGDREVLPEPTGNISGAPNAPDEAGRTVHRASAVIRVALGFYSLVPAPTLFKAANYES